MGVEGVWATKVSGRNIPYIIIVFIFSVIVFSSLLVAEPSYTVTQCSLSINDDRHVRVDLSANILRRSLAIRLYLIGVPDGNYPIVVINEKNNQLIHVLENSSLIIYTFESSNVSVTYYTSSLIESSNGVLHIDVFLPYQCEIVLPQEHVVAGLNTEPIDLKVEDKKIALLMPEGHIVIKYFYNPEKFESKEYFTTHVSSEEKQRIHPIRYIFSNFILMVIVFIAIAILVTITLVFIIVFARRKRKHIYAPIVKI